MKCKTEEAFKECLCEKCVKHREFLKNSLKDWVKFNTQLIYLEALKDSGIFNLNNEKEQDILRKAKKSVKEFEERCCDCGFHIPRGYGYYNLGKSIKCFGCGRINFRSHPETSKEFGEKLEEVFK